MLDDTMPPIIGTAMRCITSEPSTGAPQDWQQARHDGDDRHHLRPHAFDGAEHDGGLQIGAREGVALCVAAAFTSFSADRDRSA
jgi:hypothetical protein